MSISPKEKEVENFTPSVTTKAISSAKKVASHFFENPIYNILCVAIPVIMIGLFCGMTFPWQLYLIVILLSLVQIYENYKKNNTIC